MTIWRIREATPDDSDTLALIGAATFLETFAGILDGEAIVAHCASAHSEAYYSASLHGHGHAWLAEVEHGAAPIGFALIGEPELPGQRAGRNEVELKRIYSLSRYHGIGMGAALFRKVEEFAGECGAERLLLGVYAENQKAIGFYERNGFTKLTERQFQVGARQYRDWVMAKDLT